jgi:hypothetical protein
LLVLVGFAALAAGQGEAPHGDESRTLPILARMQFPLHRLGDPEPTAPRITVMRSAEEVQRHLGEGMLETVQRELEVERIDFDRQMLIHVSAGERPTGGYRIETTRIAAAPDRKTATVHCKAHPPEGFATQALTYPGELLLTPRFAGVIQGEVATQPLERKRPRIDGAPEC